MNYSTKIFAFVTCFVIVTLALTQKCHAQNLPQDYVDAHNTARATVGVGNIQWNTTLATYAQNYANTRISTCAMQHSGGPYGENLAAGSSATMTGTAAVNLWVGEKVNYDYYTNTCAPNKVCGHYTQVVWSTSGQLGCARVQCTSGWYFIICSYSARGNYIGQKPY
ncbi:pathogenesis-related protein PRB1-3-like [Spinacia oleracea]|uniref:Pathogenesis-related protein PRB1-3-like n=1 Tax=Spinacia oleracea TaxID=3562 RepID=A0A9R0K001_SPIOL|nr:pathogenesis-related protein PRB1-3-like [Spinacia oleracea]